MKSCYRVQPESSKFTFCNGLVLHKNQARSTFGDWLSGIIEFSRSLHSMDLDVSAFACLAALTLVNGKYKAKYSEAIPSIARQFVNGPKPHSN